MQLGKLSWGVGLLFPFTFGTKSWALSPLHARGIIVFETSDGLWAGFISLWRSLFPPCLCSVFHVLSAQMAVANPISSIPCFLSLAIEPKKSAPKNSRCWSTILMSTRTSRAALWKFTSKKSLTRYVWAQVFSFQQLKNFLIFAYFCWSWGKLGSVISLPLGYKPSALINFKNPLLSSAALKILVRILLFAAGLICGGLLFENNLEIFNHHFKKNSL